VAERSRRLLIVSASMGAGHDAAAEALAGRARADGHEVEIIDLLALPSMGQGKALRAFYHAMIALVPGLYDWAMRTWLRHPGIFEAITRNGGKSCDVPLLEKVAEFRPDAVVAVYNLAAQVLGRLRSSGRLSVPAATYVTDPGAHPYWVWPGVDLHLAPMSQTASDLESMGAEVVKTVVPLIGERYLAGADSDDRAAARRRWDLAADARVVLVNGGSWGVGHLVRTATRLTEAADVVMVLCGKSERLRKRLATIPKVRAIPWTPDVIGLLASCDVMIDNAGGTTCWEALAMGCAIVVHRPIAGHGRLNATVLDEAGLAPYTRTDRELIEAVRTAAPAARASEIFAGEHGIDLIESLW
jgi:UDP-N-acetylglucosamine:LPS N-acetylglucosamine transferase